MIRWICPELNIKFPTLMHRRMGFILDVTRMVQEIIFIPGNIYDKGKKRDDVGEEEKPRKKRKKDEKAEEEPKTERRKDKDEKRKHEREDPRKDDLDDADAPKTKKRKKDKREDKDKGEQLKALCRYVVILLDFPTLTALQRWGSKKTYVLVWRKIYARMGTYPL